MDLRSKINELQEKLSERENALSNVKKILSGKETELEEFKNNFSNSETKVDDFEKQLKLYVEKNEAMEKIIMDKNEVIEKLENDYEKRLLEIGELNKKIAELEENISKGQAAPEIVKNLQTMLLHKGFISDKEFYQLMDKIEKKNATINF
ncbi:MAG: hypothetical protein EU539_04370 [Promethearchaeota archaeon]|nr:MAG: hypothetical protein EU539_04370 [Candidatus Lokiarchaeota archaeon]